MLHSESAGKQAYLFLNYQLLLALIRADILEGCNMNKNQNYYKTTSGVQDSARRDTDEDVIDLGRLFGILIDHKVWIFATTALFAILALIYSAIFTPIPAFKAEAKIQVVGETSSNSLTNNNQKLVQKPLSQSEIAIENIRSRVLLSRVIDLLNLDINVTPKRLPVLGNLLMRHGVERPSFAQGWASTWANESITISEMPIDEAMIGDNFTLRVVDAGHYELLKEGELLGKGSINQLNSFVDGQIQLRITSLHAAPGAEFVLTHASRAQVVDNLRNSLSVTVVGDNTGILSLTLNGEHPPKLQRTLDAIRDLYYLQNVQFQSEEIPSSLSYFEKQLPRLRIQLGKAESRLKALRASHSDEKELSLEAKVLLDRIINIEVQVNQLELMGTELAKYYIPSQSTYAALLDRIAQRERELKKLNDRVEKLSDTDQEALRLSVNVAVLRANYVHLLNKVQEIKVFKASMIGDISIMDVVDVSPQNVKLSKTMLLTIAILIGGMLSIGVILLRVGFRSSVESPDQLEMLGLSVYATIPFSGVESQSNRNKKTLWNKRAQKFDNKLLYMSTPTDLAIESLRVLRTSLHFAMRESSSNTLMVAGPSSGIGKSFITVNLAAVCAQAGKKVLIVDADMRKGHIHSIFDESSECGLSNLLVGQKALEEVIRPVSKHEPLYYVARGNIPQNPSELLMRDKFKEFLDTVSKNYDLVIINSPPILEVTDAAVIGKLVGTTLLVSRFEVNSSKEIEASLKRLEVCGITVNGGVLNAVERKAANIYSQSSSCYNI